MSTDKYTISLSMGDVKVEAEADSAEAVLEKFKVPEKIFKMSEVTFGLNGKKKTVYMTPFETRMFNMKVRKPVLIRQFQFGLK